MVAPPLFVLSLATPEQGRENRPLDYSLPTPVDRKDEMRRGIKSGNSRDGTEVPHGQHIGWAATTEDSLHIRQVRPSGRTLLSECGMKRLQPLRLISVHVLYVRARLHCARPHLRLHGQNSPL